MFQLHERTRKRLLMAGFCALGVVPTALVLAWCVAWNLPWHARAEADRLGRLLALRVSIQKLRHPRPGAVLYEGVELADPETGEVVLSCRSIRAGWKTTDNAEGASERSLVLIVSKAQLQAGRMDRARRLVERLIACGSGGPPPDVRLLAGDVELPGTDGVPTLRDVEGGIESLPEGVQAWLSFRLPGDPTPEPARLRVARNRQLTPPATGFELFTGDTPLPCSLLALVGLPVEPLAERARFHGYIWANETPDGWQGELAGQLLDVDLDRLVTDRFPHKLGGTAEVTLTRARFSRGRLVEAGGTLRAGPGTVGRSLVESAAEPLGLLAERLPINAADELPYEQLAFSFAIDSAGLVLRGQCEPGDDSRSGVILSARYGPLLAESSDQPRPVAGLLRALVPADEVQVPATLQTDWLSRRLPLPGVVGRVDPRPAQRSFESP